MRVLVIVGILSLLAQAAAAQVSCSEDYFGHVRCTGSSGYRQDSSGSARGGGNLSGGEGVSEDPSNAVGPDWHSDQHDADWYAKRQDEIGCTGEAQRSGNYPGEEYDNYVANCMSEIEKERD